MDLASPSFNDDLYVDYDGAALLIGGLIVGEGQPMPPALQVAPGENWDNFDSFGISDDGSYLFTGDTDGPTATVEGAMRFEVPDLLASADGLSASAGGALDLTLFAPPELGPSLYLLLGSASGTTPGLIVDGLVLPLIVDGYFLSTLTSPNAPPLAGSFGFLDASSTAAAQLTLPPGVAAALVGLTLHHAYATFDVLAGVVTYTSSAVATTILP